MDGVYKRLIENGLLRLVCVDEVYLFVHYGLSLRTVYAMLSSTLFQHLILDKGTGYRTKIHVLFMTATCTWRIFAQFQALPSSKFFPMLSNVHWPGPVTMMNCLILINVVYSSQPSSRFIKNIGQTLKTDQKKCFIGYGNIKQLVNTISEKYGD